MKHGTYIGPIKCLQGHGALLQVHKRWVRAQFDDGFVLHNRQWLGWGWYKFKKKHWEFD